MKKTIALRKESRFVISGVLLSMLIAGSAGSAVTSIPTSTVKGRAPTVTESNIVSDNANGNGLIDVGDTLSVGTPGVFSDLDGDTATQETYQWQAGGVDIPGATNNSYAIVADDLGKTMTLRVTPNTDPAITDPAVGSSVVSNALTVISSGTVTGVTITGEVGGYPQVDTILTATATCAGGACNSVTYQWQIETALGSNTYTNINGATGNTYTPTRTDQKLKVQAIVSN
ncbi:ZirU family protein [Yersinia intermedia]|uniref:ZirU family protein n=2 Tax=Yersinia intermedia TaxID=631 RepID=UPI0021BDBA60|nr:ZirU family protein [Yersinia intermedia]MCW8111145.1 ZirU family protein [Yersinia intermedia]MDA5515793.1 ZirU family protein [Yersinia intermedia]